MNTHKTVGIIGCGWLGWPLAKQLIIDGYHIHGTTTSISKVEALRADGIQPFLIELSDEKLLGDIEGFLSTCDILIINVPPKLRLEEDLYVPKMKRLIGHIENSDVDQVLFIGSTSVYDDSKPFAEITESSKTSHTEKALKLLEVEQLFQKHTKFQTTILRFSGLFGEDRHPAKFLSGRSNVKNPDAPVNLIHLSDCISIIRKILVHELWNETLNAATISHPIREVYYSKICRSMHIPIPQFDHSMVSVGKVIHSDKLIRLITYQFKVKL